MVQTVSRASVTVDGEVVGAIADGLLVLVGVTHDDTADDADAGPAGVRAADPRRRGVRRDTGAPLLVVSQFTLYADTRKGRRPSWSAAAPAELAEPLVEAFVAALRERGRDGGRPAGSGPGCWSRASTSAPARSCSTPDPTPR